MSIFVSMRLSIPTSAAAAISPDLSRKVVQGGATLVQLRDKTGSTLRMIEEARAIKAALSGSFVPLLINDRVDVALASGADGVHVGWDDMPVADARRLLGREAIIGLSIKTPEQVAAAPLELLDYVCIGGVFQTSSKDNKEPPVRPEGFAKLAAMIRARAPHMPAGAIAGIDESNAASRDRGRRRRHRGDFRTFDHARPGERCEQAARHRR